MDVIQFIYCFCAQLGYSSLATKENRAFEGSFIQIKTDKDSTVDTPGNLQCPNECKCYLVNNKLETDCSKMRLEHIPNDVSRGTTILLLNNNNISADMSYPLSFVQLGRLEHLDLSYNAITSLGNTTFTGLSRLKYLSLAFNGIKTADSLSKNVFKPLVMLNVLEIHGNCDSYRDRKCDYHDTELGMLPNLQDLVMDGLTNKNLGQGFEKLKKLRYLKLHSSYCRLHVVNVRTFKYLRNSALETLDLTECHIDEAAPYSFAVLKHLGTLILSGNDNLCVNGLSNISTGLNGTNITNLILKNTCNHLQNFLGYGPLYDMRDTKLLKLDLENCKILNLSLMFILTLPKSLVYFSLRDNKLLDGHALLAIPSMPNLEYLDGSKQEHYSFNNLTSRHAKNLQPNRVDISSLSHNGQSRPRSLSNGSGCCDSREKTLQMTIDLKKTFRIEKHIPWPSVILLPPKLKYVNVSFLLLDKYIPSINFTANNSIELLDISNSLLKGFCGKIYGLHGLKYLNLSHCNISVIDPFTFGDMPSLYDINLSGNPLGEAIAESSDLLFSNLTQLTYLDMSSASLKQLPWKLFVRNTNLKVLKLLHNFFVTITFSVETLSSLKFLDFSHNSITQISQETIQQLEHSCASRTVELNLVKNPLTCTCDHQPFVHWLADSGRNIRLSSYETLTCLYNNNTEVKLTSLNELSFDIECITSVVLTSCVVAFCMLIIVLSSAAYVYTQRWKLRYLYYVGRRNMDPYHPLLCENVNLSIDVYISFDEAAVMPDGTDLRHFVTNNLYLRLQQKQFVVKIRDELASEKPLYKTISEIVRTSRKVIVFLDKNYCSEFWNVFEFNMAAYEGIYTSRDVIIPVIVENCFPQALSAEIKTFLSNRQIIPLTSDTDLSEFIDKLEIRIRS